MSGTSMDGLDIAFCEFRKLQKGWTYTLLKAELIRYPKSWEDKLRNAFTYPASDLVELDVAYGKWLGETCKKFITQHNLKVDFIASHGHTIFHQPSKGFTLQIGNGNAIHAESGIPVIFDFRSLDIMHGGEGAPLVPAGDKLLFNQYDVCLNLGGIANLSLDKGKVRSAFDVCFCNMPLNHLMMQKGKAYDKNGELASEGKINEVLLKKFQNFYKRIRSKRPSLGREIFENDFLPLLDEKKIFLEDKLATCVESTAIEICAAVPEGKYRTMLCTGGGAFNSFLMSRILFHGEDRITPILPEVDVIKFKEALVFAFLGVLRYSGEINCLSSVTGATKNSSSGVMAGFRF